VNEWTIKNRYPLPLIPELIARVKGASLFTKFDVRWGYNNVRIKEGDQWKAAFITNQGLFEPNVMFFGLTNSPATFQTMMNSIFLEEVREGWLTIYMDDMSIHTDDNIASHKKAVHRMLDKLREHDLFLKPEKCLFKQKQMEFLGVLENGTIQMDPAKVQRVADWPRPRNVRDVRAFLEFTGFYRYFVPNYSIAACPLIDLTKKATPFHCAVPTRLLPTLLPRHGRIGVRRGSRTLTGGRLQHSHQKIYPTTNRVLLCHVHSHRTKLRHLREKTTSRNEGPRTLEATPSGYGRTSHGADRPRQFDLLEKPQKGQPASGQMVRNPTGLQPGH
jgi:hypothetical protein